MVHELVMERHELLLHGYDRIGWRVNFILKCSQPRSEDFLVCVDTISRDAAYAVDAIDSKQPISCRVEDGRYTSIMENIAVEARTTHDMKRIYKYVSDYVTERAKMHKKTASIEDKLVVFMSGKMDKVNVGFSCVTKQELVIISNMHQIEGKKEVLKTDRGYTKHFEKNIIEFNEWAKKQGYTVEIDSVRSYEIYVSVKPTFDFYKLKAMLNA